MSISKEYFYKLLNEGLFQKYCRKAGSAQDIAIVYSNKQDISILQVQEIFDTIEIDFIGDFVEEKIIYADLSNPIHIETRLNGIKGTLFRRDSVSEDLILELSE